MACFDQETESVYPYACLNSKKTQRRNPRARSLPVPTTPKPKLVDRRPSSIFLIARSVDKETLLAHSGETLASANVIGKGDLFSESG